MFTEPAPGKVIVRHTGTCTYDGQTITVHNDTELDREALLAGSYKESMSPWMLGNGRPVTDWPLWSHFVATSQGVAPTEEWVILPYGKVISLEAYLAV